MYCLKYVVIYKTIMPYSVILPTKYAVADYQKLTQEPKPIYYDLLFFSLFYWRNVDFQCCVTCCCPAQGFFFIFLSVMVYPRMLNTVLCSTVGPGCLSILYIPVLHLLTQTNNPSLPTPTPGSRKPVLCVWVCFRFIEKFTWVVC